MLINSKTNFTSTVQRPIPTTTIQKNSYELQHFQSITAYFGSQNQLSNKNLINTVSHYFQKMTNNLSEPEAGVEMQQNKFVSTHQIQIYSDTQNIMSLIYPELLPHSRNHNILSITYPDLELSSEYFYIQLTYTQVQEINYK